VRVIKDNQVIEDDWVLLDEPAASDLNSGNNIIVPFSWWLENRDVLLQHEAQLGVSLDGAVLIEDVARDLDHFRIIALKFPAFADGRCYTHARLLRDRYQYTGELRAVGDILRDQLFYLKRCGMNSFQVREDKDIKDAMKGLSDFSITYQTAADGATPVYKNR